MESAFVGASAIRLDAMPLKKGQSVLCQYQPDWRWLERVVIRHILDQEYWLATGEYELFRGALRSPEPVLGMRLLPPSRQPPRGISPDDVDFIEGVLVLGVA